MKKKYTLLEDGFVGYWHPAWGHEGRALIVFPGSGADYVLTWQRGILTDEIL